MFLVDTAAGRIVDDAEIKGALAAEHPYADWLHAGLIRLDDLPAREREVPIARRADAPPAGLRLHRGGAQRPAQADGRERRRADRLDGQRRAAGRRSRSGRGSSTTTSPSCSRRSPTRRWTRSGRSWSPRCRASSAPSRTCSAPARPAAARSCCRSRCSATTTWPRSCTINDDGELPGLQLRTPCAACSTPPRAATGLRKRLDEISAEVSRAIADGARLIVLSSRGVDAEHAPIPSLLLTGAVHHHLVREKHPHPGRADRRVRRRPRGAPHRAADRLRRGRGQPVPGHGHRRGPGAARRHPRRRRRRRRPRTWSRRWARACARRCPRWASPRWPPTPARRSSRRSGSAPRSSTPASPAPRRGWAGSASTCSPRRCCAAHRRAYPADDVRAQPPRAGGRRRVPVAARGRAAPVQPADGVQAAALHPAGPLRHLQGLHPPGRRAVAPADDAARAVPLPRGRAPAGADRRGRAGRVDRQAVRHRRHLLRLDLAGDARDAGHRDEPARRASPTPARAARTPTATPRTPTATPAARRSSRSPPAGSA